MARDAAKQTAKVFMAGRSQAVRIPKKYRLSCDEVLIQRKGRSLVLTPRYRSWKEYLGKPPRLPDDFPEDIQIIRRNRSSLFKWPV
jgi:antitoxin VapB